MDSITAEKLSPLNERLLLLKENKNKGKEKEKCLTKKKLRQQKYVYLLDKPLEKILIRYINNNKITLNFNIQIIFIL